MQCFDKYKSPIGDIMLSADNQGLTGLWFDGGKVGSSLIQSSNTGRDASKFIEEGKEWLDLYFDGTVPEFTPKLHLVGSEFRLEVWKRLLKIPYGETTTYGELAEELARQKGMERMAAQAIGGAVGRNEISIIVPCHRVVGKGGKLTGYGGGLDKKIYLLELEQRGIVSIT